MRKTYIILENLSVSFSNIETETSIHKNYVTIKISNKGYYQNGKIISKSRK